LFIDLFVNVDPPPKEPGESKSDSDEDLDDSQEDLKEEEKRGGGKKEKKENTSKERTFKIKFFTSFDKDLILHWGIGRDNPHEWSSPDKTIWPANSNGFDPSNSAVQTKFVPDKKEKDYKSINMKVPADNLKIKGMSFVFFIPEWNKWHNNMGGNYKIIFEVQEIQMDIKILKGESPEIVNIVKEIIQCETVYDSWTLMHRYNKCVEMLNKVKIESPQEM